MPLIQRGSGIGVTMTNDSKGAYNPLPSTPRGLRRKSQRPDKGMPYLNTKVRKGGSK